MRYIPWMQEILLTTGGGLKKIGQLAQNEVILVAEVVDCLYTLHSISS